MPTLIGHTSLNHALRYIDMGRISAAMLSEPIFAGLVAWWAWHEDVSLQTLLGYLLICASVVVLVLDRDRSSAPAVP